MANPSTSIQFPAKRTRRGALFERLSRNTYEHVLPSRYLVRNDAGDVIETPAEMFCRVAEAIALAEREFGTDADQWMDRFEATITDLEFIPNSPTLMNAGTRPQQLSACFVVSPDDSMESIFETPKHAATILQTGGGVGYMFSRLRPYGGVVRSSGSTASFQYDIDTSQLTDYLPPRGITNNWIDIAAVGLAGEETLYMVDDSGHVLRGVTNGGNIKWDEPQTPCDGSDIMSVVFIDEAGFLCDTNAGVYETTDDGNT